MLIYTLSVSLYYLKHVCELDIYLDYIFFLYLHSLLDSFPFHFLSSQPDSCSQHRLYTQAWFGDIFVALSNKGALTIIFKIAAYHHKAATTLYLGMRLVGLFWEKKSRSDCGQKIISLRSVEIYTLLLNIFTHFMAKKSHA